MVITCALRRAGRLLTSAIVLQTATTLALTLDLNDAASIKAAAKTIAYDMMTQYTGNQSGQTPGLLPATDPTTGLLYYWWEGGAMWGSLIDYWYYTGDSTYNDVTTQGLLFQAGSDNNYEPTNQTFDLGNDDQAFWAMAALSAAELNFPNPPSDQPQWLELAQAVFNRQAQRWDTATCGGGLRWQIFEFNGGYTYKNAISNGCFFNIASRLWKYTGNQTYGDWANKAWDWSQTIGLIDKNFNVFDGTSVNDNCTSLDYLQWSYNVGVYLLGAATMWNLTESDATAAALWKSRTDNLLTASNTFFTNNSANTMNDIMWEIECETKQNCNNDQKSFKAYLSRWMAATTKVAPWTYDTVFAKLTNSAKAAALACSGGTTGTFCGLKWTTGTWDGTLGFGQQMDALEVIQANLINAVSAPVTSNTGGTSEGDPSAGTSTSNDPSYVSVYYDITTSDRAGAGVLTAMLCLTTICGALWMIW